MQAGSVLHLCTKFETDCSIRSKVIKGSRNEEIKSRDRPRPVRGRCMAKNVAPSSMSVPNLKRIALFVQKLLGGPKFRPTADPFPGARDGQNLISWRWSLPLPTNPFGEDRCTQFRVIVVTHTHTHTHTHTPTDRTDYNTLCRS